MRKLLFCLTALALAASVPAFAVSQASPDDAKSMAIKAAEYLRSAPGPTGGCLSSMPRTIRGTTAIFM